jgi:hypothetical protein
MTRKTIPLWFAAVLILAGFAAADGQTGSTRPTSKPDAEPADQRITVHTVKIVPEGICNVPDKVLVVADDLDIEILPRPNQKEFFDTKSRFNARKGHVSLRMGPKPAWRTDCHKATEVKREDPKDPENWVAEFWFSMCPTASVQQVSIGTEPSKQPVKIGYVRELPGNGSSVDCAEGRLLDGPINYVEYKREKLHLQIARDAPNLKACGLVVNDADARKYAKPNTDELLVFEKAAIAEALRELRNMGKTCAAPSLSGPAFENDLDRLTGTKLTKLYVRVKPQPEPAVK